MSREDLEEVGRRIADALSRRDVATLEALSWPEVEYSSRFAAVEGRTYRGHCGWSRYVADVDEAWDDFKITIEEFGPQVADKLVATVRVTALARASRVRIDQRVYAAWQFRDGKALWGRNFDTQAEAVRAVGLEE